MYFTYLLGWTKQNKYYYGVRYKDGITEESIGTTYWSSSKYVKKFIEQHGKPDIIEVRKKFDCKKKAKQWEDVVIRRVRKLNADLWLNKSNNNGFRSVVMDNDIKTSISKAKKGKKLGIMYNNGTTNKLFKDGEVVPPEFIKGRIQSKKQKEHVKRLHDFNKNKDEDLKSKHYKKISNKTKGSKKPDGFGEKISKKLAGIKRPYNMGDNNPARRSEVREKISQNKKGKKLNGVWYTNGTENLFVYYEDTPPDGFYRGKTITESERARRKEFYANAPQKRWYNNGETCKQFIENEQPNGFVLGRLPLNDRKQQV